MTAMDTPSHQHGGLPRVAAPGVVSRPLAGDIWSKGLARSAAVRSVSPRRRTLVRLGWMACSLLVLIYSLAVLTHVAAMGTIGVRCMFGTRVEEEIPGDYVWDDSRPHIGDWLLSIGGFAIHQRNYGDYIRALRGLSNQIGSTVQVSWRDQKTETVHSANVLVQRPPSWTYYRSLVWFLQELLIFAIGARVFWKRPEDESAQLFFAVCIVTVGAFMGGYHWTEIVTEPGLIYPFALFAVFVPVVNLHFFLVFPRPNPVLVRHKRWVLGRTLWHPDRLSDRPLGKHVRGPLVLAARRPMHRRRRRFASCDSWQRATSRWPSFLYALCISASSTATATHRPAASATRCSGSCWPR